jgi:hypothetical protein
MQDDKLHVYAGSMTCVIATGHEHLHAAQRNIKGGAQTTRQFVTATRAASKAAPDAPRLADSLVHRHTQRARSVHLHAGTGVQIDDQRMHYTVSCQR